MGGSPYRQKSLLPCCPLRAQRGALVDVLEDNGDGWPRIRYGDIVGYASAVYLTSTDEEDNEEVEIEEIACTTLINADGTKLILGGVWMVAED